MFGFFLIIVSSLLSEVSDVIGKERMKAGQVSLYTTGFLMLFFGFIFLIVYAFWADSFRFSVLSLPTLIPRIILEVILSWITIKALAKANRSTFGFLRTLTIPLLLMADIILGYVVEPKQVVGIIIITIIVALYLALSGRFEKRGAGLLLLSAVLPVATLSLYKYNISHFNSVEAEQILVSSVLIIFFLCMAIFKVKENPFKFIVRPVFFLQAASVGLASVIGSFAYLFLLPSVAVAILRSSSVFFATLSGDLYFKEKSPLLKFLISFGLIIGLVFLA